MKVVIADDEPLARERLRAGNPASLLDGVPLAWKDLFDIKDTVTTAGSAVLRGSAPAAQDAALVAGRSVSSIFIGGGTPSVFSAAGIGQILTGVKQQLQCDAGAAQFAVDVGAVGLQVARRAGYGRFVEPCLELFVAQGLGRF